MRSHKYCGYNLQIVFREHSLIISTRDLGMRQQSIYDCYPSLQSWMAFEKIHRPLFAESKHVDFPNNNSVSTSYNGAFCKVRRNFTFKQKKALYLFSWNSRLATSPPLGEAAKRPTERQSRARVRPSSRAILNPTKDFFESVMEQQRKAAMK